ncbi:MAG: hypothetical protein WKF79_03075 [Nocardioides sp.]
MSATSISAPAHEAPTGTPPHTGSTERPSTSGRAARRQPRSPLAASVTGSLARSGKWSEWLSAEPRLAGFTSLEDALEGWRRRDLRCYQVVSGLTALGSRRGGDDDDAALAVVVLLAEGVARVAMTVSDVWELEDVSATVWEEVKVAEPQLGGHAARYLLQRARQRLIRPAAGMVARVETTSLDQRLGWDTDGTEGAGGETRDLALALPQVEDPATDLADLLAWAGAVGVIAPEEIDLLIELLAAGHDGMPREDAQRLVGERRGLSLRTIRRRRDATVARLREAAPKYLAATA